MAEELRSKEGTTQRVLTTFAWKKSGLDCLICAMFSRCARVGSVAEALKAGRLL